MTLSEHTHQSEHDAGQIGVPERILSVVTGLALAAVATQPRPNRLLSLMALGAGSFLAYRGATGTCPIRAALES